ncbi:MAG: hypothetical protein ACTTJ4_07310 [Treponema sp.]|uniref:hypothetical protein n=1 Tax=Treponema sp. TaxID=166 RepID=UPI003FA27547
MKHKILSIITALMMLSTVALITGCNNLQGNKLNNSSSQGSNGNNKDSNGGKQGNNENNQGNQNALVGVWKITKVGNVTYPVNSPAGGTQQLYMAFTADGKILMALELKGFPSQNGLYRINGDTQYKLLPGNKIETVEHGETKTVSYTLSGNSLKISNTPEEVFEATKVTSPTEAQIKAAPEMQHNNGGNNQGNNSGNQGNNGNNQGNNGNNQGNNGNNQGNNGNNQGNNSGNQATQQDLQGVWKVTAQGQYAMHILVEGTTVHAAMEAPSMPGSFVKVPLAVTYNSDGTISVSGQNLTPVKNGEAIDLQYSGYTAYKLIKDANVSADTIKNAPATPQP